jgi:hypothetical protein
VSGVVGGAAGSGPRMRMLPQPGTPGSWVGSVLCLGVPGVPGVPGRRGPGARVWEGRRRPCQQQDPACCCDLGHQDPGVLGQRGAVARLWLQLGQVAHCQGGKQPVDMAVWWSAWWAALWAAWWGVW